MGKDLLNEPYGRFFHLAKYLAGMGHQVRMVLISYRHDENESVERDNVQIQSISLLPNPVKALYDLSRLVKSVCADWVFGFSDTYYGIMAYYFASKMKKRCLIDAYDNYEAYLPLAKPLHWYWRRTLAKADLLSCAGPVLAELFSQHRRHLPIEILPMAVDDNSFGPESRRQCRERLRLPLDKKLIGYHGSISDSRDISMLFSAVEELIPKDEHIVLVLSGRLSPSVELPAFTRFLGYLPDSMMSAFVNSMDVIAVPNKISGFGQYSHPVKIYEAMACGIPVLATKTRATAWILSRFPSLLVEPGSVGEFSKGLQHALTLDRVEYGDQAGWAQIGAQLNRVLLDFDAASNTK